ncbi:MAG TPA: hypothetical protein VGL95_12355, partial [Acetobacteraceae bacterium]
MVRNTVQFQKGLSGPEFEGLYVIEENERTDHAPASERQHAADREPASEVPRVAVDDQIEHGSLLS